MPTEPSLAPPFGQSARVDQVLRTHGKIRACKLTVTWNEGNMRIFELARRKLDEAEGARAREKVKLCCPVSPETDFKWGPPRTRTEKRTISPRSQAQFLGE